MLILPTTTLLLFLIINTVLDLTFITLDSTVQPKTISKY